MNVLNKLAKKDILSLRKHSTKIRSVQTAANDDNVRLKDFSEIPGPKIYPILKSFPSVLASGHRGPQIYRWLMQLHEKYGPIYKFEVPFVPRMVSTINVDDIESLCRTTMDNPIRFGFHSLKHVRDNTPDNYFNKKAGLLPENGEEWWRLRSRVQAHMLKPKNIAKYLPSMDDVSKDFLDRIWLIQSNNNGQVPEEFLKEIYKWALESVCLVALNRRMGCLQSDMEENSTPMTIIKAGNEMMSCMAHTESDYFWKIIKTSPMKRLEKAHHTFLTVAEASMREAEEEMERRGEEEDNNILYLLLKTPGLSRSDVMTMLLDTIMAGIDTTSHTLVFVLYLLAKNPDCQKKLQEEVDRVVGKDQTNNITPQQLNQMHYLKAVIKETLRIQPLLPGVGRVATSDLALSGYVVPKDTLVFGLTMLTGVSEEYFNEANKFIPERWFREKPLGEINPFASLPFSHGKRMCIGRRIAEQELFTFFLRMAQRYTVKYNDDHPLLIESQLVFKPIMPLSFTFMER